MDGRGRLANLLGGPALARVRARLRKRFESGNAGGTLTIDAPDDAERAALCGLLGRPWSRSASVRVDLDELDAVLRRGGVAVSLRAALELLDGPIPDRVAQRDAAALAWQAVCSVAEPRLAAWLTQPRALGLVKRLSHGDAERAARACAQAGTVLRALPCAPTARSHLSARLLGDAHALDPGRVAATLVLSVLRHTTARTDEDLAPDESDRVLWATAGILVNELARPALFLNLPSSDAAPGEPSYLSLRALVRKRREWAVAGSDVYVCENPNMVAIAADVLGVHCAPLVCTDGMPSAAQRALLSQLSGAGARLRYHGDFDWPGLAIGNIVIGEFGASPWRFGAADYRTAAASAAASSRHLVPPGRAASWDDLLQAAMLEWRKPVDEEGLVETLIADLDVRSPTEPCISPDGSL
jgi:uncharacterized protein (TIGR02679 family)